jgi:VanZ family protein
MRASTRRFASRHLPALAWAAVILVVLGLPSALVGPWADRLPLGGLPIDKLIHLALFLVMAILAERSLAAFPRLRRTVLAAFLAASAYGALAEAAQLAWTDRTAEWGDLAADVAGAGWAAALIARRRRGALPRGPLADAGPRPPVELPSPAPFRREPSGEAG